MRQKYWISILSTPESRQWVLNYLQNHNNLKSAILSNLLSVFAATLGHPAHLLPWEQDFEKEEERGDSGCTGGSSKHTPDSPGAHSLCRIQVCELPLPGPAAAAWGAGGPLSPAPAVLGLC